MRDWGIEALKGMRQRGDEWTVQVARTFAQLGKELNRATGYEEIDQLKRRVVEQGVFGLEMFVLPEQLRVSCMVVCMVLILLSVCWNCACDMNVHIFILLHYILFAAVRSK